VKFKALTPTILGQYIHHHCERKVYYDLLPDEDPRKPVKAEMDPRLIDRGLEHEEQVLRWYRNQGLQVVEVTGPEAAEQTRELIREGKADLIYQAYLYSAGRFRQVYAHLPLVVHGYPDLLRKRTDKTTSGGQTLYEVGDIKASLQPKLYQKYQVTLYSHLLYYTYRDLYRGETVYYPERGFIVPFAKRNAPLGRLYKEENFDLEPFRYALEDVFWEIAQILAKEPQEASWHLDVKCESCGYFKHCRAEAQAREDLSLIPFLRKPQKRRLLGEGIATVGQAAQLDPSLYRKDWILARSAEQIRVHARALKENKVLIKERTSHLVPNNLQVEIYVDVETDLVHQIAYLYGLLIREPGKEDRLETFFVSDPADEGPVFERFLMGLQGVWKDCQEREKMAHLFLYDGSKKRQLYRAWEKYALEEGGGEALEDRKLTTEDRGPQYKTVSPELLTLLQQLLFGEQTHCTHLHQVLQQTLALPVESAYALPEVAQVLGYPGSVPQAEGLSPQVSPDFIHLYWRTQDPTERSRYHHQILAQGVFNLQALAHIYRYLKSTLSWPRAKTSMALDPVPLEWTSLKGKLLSFLKTERGLKIQEIKEFQRLPVEERVARYRCIAGLKYLKLQPLPSGKPAYVFSYAASGAQSKFRGNEFLKLSPLHRPHESQSVLLVQNHPRKLQLILEPRGKGSLALDPQILYTLDEDLEDFTFPKVWDAVNRAFSQTAPLNFFDLLNGKYLVDRGETASPLQAQAWLESMKKVLDFDESQERAFLLPFTYDLSLIQGPPGTGKTHVLAWILLAQAILAQCSRLSMRILVSAVSHRAINNVLRKVASHLNEFMDGRSICPLYKLNQGGGEAEELNPEKGPVCVQEIGRRGNFFPQDPQYILGATPQGIYSAIKDKNYWTTRDPFESLFDLVVFDEASQVPVPLAILAMLYGKGRFLFVGDENQMPPIVQGTYPENEYYHRSIFEYLKSRRGYRACTVMLTQTRRMNQELTEFPSQTFYYNRLKPHARNARLKLSPPSLLRAQDLTGVTSPGEPLRSLPPPPNQEPRAAEWIDEILSPSKPVVLVETPDELSQQLNLLEVRLVVDLTRRLVLDYQIPLQNLAIIAPHRAQNNEITARLAELLQNQGMPPGLLPLADTVERIQGQERDVIIISLTASDPDYILAESEFLLSPNRLNVALTRASRKLIVIGSRTVFRIRPDEESLLKRAMFLKKFRKFCERKKAIIPLPDRYFLDHRR